MTRKAEWQAANLDVMAEERRKLGDPPTAEEMLKYDRGELSETEEERIRDLLVAYPEVARMYGAEFPATADHAGRGAAAGWEDLQRRMGGESRAARPPGRVLPFRPLYAIAAVFLIVCVGVPATVIQVQRYVRQANAPRVLGAAQELTPDGNRGPGAPTVLRKDGDAYLLRPRLINQVRYPHYGLELHDARGKTVWTSKGAQPDEDDAFQITIPHDYLRDGETYRLQVFGIDGEGRTVLGTYDVSVPVE